jgi:hypothetical protein
MRKAVNGVPLSHPNFNLAAAGGAYASPNF